MTDHAFTVSDREYLRHGDDAFLARIYLPDGDGPFPCIVEVHGGGWSQFDRLRGKHLHEALARSGCTVMAIDFRQGSKGAYPRSVADVHYAVRWAKAHARELKTAPDMVGMSGNSSGGHLAMLMSMRPEDPRYAALPVDGPTYDSRVRCVVMLWPVINPFGRYRYAKSILAQPDPPAWPNSLIPLHDAYWGDEAAMAEGSPLLILERGEPAELVPAMWVQSTQDRVHNYKDPSSDFPGPESDRFAKAYRAAGGEIQTFYFDEPMTFTNAHAELPESSGAMASIVQFVHRCIRPPVSA